MSAKDWGKDNSKTVVVCKYYSKEMRKDNLGRHTAKQHPGKKEAFSHKNVKGQSSLSSMLGLKPPGEVVRVSSAPMNVNVPPAAEDIDMLDQNPEVDDTVADTNSASGSSVWPGSAQRINEEAQTRRSLTPGEEEDYMSSLSEPNKKRHCSGTDADASTNLEIHSLLKSFKDDIVSEVSGLLRKSKIDTKPNSEKYIESESELLASVHNSETIDSLKETLEENNFTIDTNKNLILCDICTEDPYHIVLGYDNKAGIFQYDFAAHNTMSEIMSSQARPFLNLKKSIARHISDSQTHSNLKEKKERDIKEAKAREARNHEIGLHLFRLRYLGIKQGDSYLNFKNSLLTAHLNKVDIGDINNSFHFARDITKHIKKAMESKFADSLSVVLEGTNEKRPVGIVADKITPNKRTGHIIGLIVPTPENPMTESFLVPVLLATPPVKDHTALGLAEQVKGVVTGAGVVDGQEQGGGVDGQYILMGVWDKLLDLLELGEDGMALEKLRQWVTVIWEPAHNINLADGDVRNLVIFDWLVRLTSCVGDVTATLGIGKGLEQCFEEAEESGQKFYKFKTFSKTRFAPYAVSSYSNFEKNFEVLTAVLRERLDSPDKKVRDSAAGLLNSIQNVQFCALLCGVIDVYTVLSQTSCAVQKVEQFPFEMKGKLAKGISKLKQMSEKFSLEELDCSDWPLLSKNLADLKAGMFHSVELRETAARKLTRCQSDMGDLACLKTVENRLKSLAKYQAKIIENRTINNTDHPYPKILELMSKCLDAQLVVDGSSDETFDLDSSGNAELGKLCKIAGYSAEQIKVVTDQYILFKRRLLNFVIKDDKSDARKNFGHILFDIHECGKECQARYKQNCKDFNKVQIPLKINNMKVLHLFLKNEFLFSGIEKFLAIFTKCAVKTHAEGVAESMGNYVDIHSEKRRGLDVSVVGQEAYIHWNGPPVHHWSQ